jgi:FHA domain
MNQLTLEWQDAAQRKTKTLSDQQPTKYPGTIRLGRDPVRCDIVLSHPTVSGLHIEIFFNPGVGQFYLRNLRESNPPWVDGTRLNIPEVPLNQGSTIYLGEIAMQVTAISIDANNLVSHVPPTILVAPNAPAAIHPSTTKPPNPIYGLECPHCQRICPYERLDLGCPWCGTSLAAAASVLMSPKLNLGYKI